MATSLPIEAIRSAFVESLARGPVVLTSPTGSGKSTQVPRWCEGRVLVVEPRRVASKTLAMRVAELEGCTLGSEVGFHVRDHRAEQGDTRILFATPGVVLRRFEELERFEVVILDEFHERTIEVDLILALLRKRYRGQLVVMSATMRAAPLAAYLEGEHLHGAGELYPVEIRYAPQGVLLPEREGLVERVCATVQHTAAEAPGDVLVFLPGKAEIAAVVDSLGRCTRAEVLPLHGGLSLDQQARVFRPSDRRKIIVATNVAETSITVPGIGVVIDSGLVRRTRYHRGRGFLTLMPIAADSAEQRTGRAGRTGPGVCVRLWSEQARLETNTPPEIRREALLPLVLAAAACQARVDELRFLDPPEPHAVTAAHADGQALGAVDDQGRITATGRNLFGLPLDPPLGRLLIEAERRDSLADAIDLVSVLAVGRALFRSRPERWNDEDLRCGGCDATGLITALRRGHPREHDLSHHVLQEARGNNKRLRTAMGLRTTIDRERPVDRQALALTAIAADPRAAHVARQRRGRTYWSNGGTEIELARHSAAQLAEHPEALVVYETRALGVGWRQTRIVATCASPVPLALLVQADLGRERVARVTYRQGQLLARIERVFARKVLSRRDDEPTGALAREAVAQLIIRGSLFPSAAQRSRERLRDREFVSLLPSRLLPPGRDRTDCPSAVELEPWLLGRLDELGLERGEDIALLSEQDVVAPELDPELAAIVQREFPRALSAGGARYEVDYDLQKRQVALRWIQGQRGRCPELCTLPGFAGFSIRVDTGRGSQMLRT